MFGRIKFLASYLFFWVLFFEGCRVLFLLYHHTQSSQLSFATIAGSIWHGTRMDLSMAGYLLVPVCLAVVLSIFLIPFRKPFFYQVYTSALLAVGLLLTIADLESFRAWGTRLDPTPFKYLSSPKEAWASISHLPIIWIIISYLLVFGLLCFFTSKWIRKQAKRLWCNSNKTLNLGLVLAFAALLIVPIRGSFGLSPMNQSTVYFSTNNFANQVAINAPWNLLYALMDKTSQTKNPYLYLPNERAKAIVDSLYGAGQTSAAILNTEKPNIIFVIWESFTEKATHSIIDGKEVTPNFNKLKAEGLYFSQVYASGDRTDRGLSAILSGYPALPQTSIVRSPGKSAKVATLSQAYRSKGYQTAFYYGGETEFANIKSYLLQGGYQSIVDIRQFSKKNQNSKWGVHDGVMAARIQKDLAALSAPFFATWLTLTSHEPFETPVPTVFGGADDTNKFLNSLHYSDAVIGDFIAACKKQPWWQNTLVIIVADHGHPLPATGAELDRFKIPVLWLGGALKEKGGTVDKVVSQVDIAATIAGQTGIKTASFPFSKNSFDTTAKPWAFFSFNNGFGYVEPRGALIFSNTGKRLIEPSRVLQPSILEAGKALQQQIFQDYLDK